VWNLQHFRAEAGNEVIGRPEVVRVETQSPMEGELESIVKQPLHNRLTLVRHFCARAHPSLHETLPPEAADIPTLRAQKKVEIESLIKMLNQKYSEINREIVEKHKATKEVMERVMKKGMEAETEMVARIGEEMDRIALCKLEECDVADVVMLILSTGAKPDVEAMKTQNVDSEVISTCENEFEIQRATGIKECADLYRVLIV